MKRNALLMVISILAVSMSVVGCRQSGEEEHKGKKESSKDHRELSDDLYSFQISIDDTIYQFPMTYDEFVDLGWNFGGDETQTFDSDNHIATVGFDRGDYFIDAIMYSLDEGNISDCYIGGLDIIEGMMEDTKIILPGGIEFDNATKEDIIDTYGEPTEIFGSGGEYEDICYGVSTYQEVKFSFNEGKLNEVKLVNMVDLADIETETAK